MKKLIIGLVFSLMLVGCSSSSSGDETADSDNVSSDDAMEVNEAYMFEYNDTVVSMNAECKDVLAGLGEEMAYYEAKSCAFEGLDKTYTYAGFQLLTYPLDDVDYVYSIVLKDDTVSTQEGLCIGDERAKVEETYGLDYSEDNGAYTYTLGDSTLEFIFDEDEVSAITYTAITE